MTILRHHQKRTDKDGFSYWSYEFCACCFAFYYYCEDGDKVALGSEVKRLGELFVFRSYLWNSFWVLLLITLLSHLFYDSLDIINIALIYIIPVVIISIYGDPKATAFITLLCVISFNFLYVPPLYSFSVNNELYLWSFGIFGVVGLIITLQARHLHAQKRQNILRESLLHIISHDLRTPLATIHGSINLILTHQNLEQEKVVALLEDIDYASLRMKRLITNIFDATRVSGEEIMLKHEWCDFEDMLGVALEEFSKKQNELIKLDIKTLSLYWGDNMMLTRLIVNLLDNALKYSTPNTNIELSITETKEEFILSITNQTQHPKKIKIENIFDKFYRLEDVNDISGSGIGLAMCKNIVTLHGGKIEARLAQSAITIEARVPITKKAGLV